MRRLGNTLYVMSPGSYLFCENGAIGIKIGGEEKVRLPAHTIDSVICFGQMTVTTPLISFCGEHGISLSFMTEQGRFMGRINGPVSGNVLLRRRQYRALDDETFCRAFVADLLCGKLLNSKNLLLRSARDQSDNQRAQTLKEAARDLTELTASLRTATSVASLRGIEGLIASKYFSQFDKMLKTPENICFGYRSRRPPHNEVNAVLSFLYMLLKNDMQAALEGVGLDPAAGFLHVLRPGRPALALDLMEELRAPLCDRMALALFNLNQLKADDFCFDSGIVTMKERARKAVVSAWQSRKKEEVQHSFLHEKIPIGLIPHTQALLLARFFRGDIDLYPPFVWR